MIVHPPCRPHREERRRKHDVLCADTSPPSPAEAAHAVEVVEAQRHRDVDAATGDRVDGLTERAGAGRRRVLDTCDRDPGETELLRDADAGPDRPADVTVVQGADLGEVEPGVVQRRDTRVVGHVVDGQRVVVERMHADTDDVDVATEAAHRIASKRNVTSSRPSSSEPTGNNVSPISSPISQSSLAPISGAWMRTPSGRSTCPTP